MEEKTKARSKKRLTILTQGYREEWVSMRPRNRERERELSDFTQTEPTEPLSLSLHNFASGQQIFFFVVSTYQSSR